MRNSEEDCATRLLAAHWNGAVPVSLAGIVKGLGVVVRLSNELPVCARATATEAERTVLISGREPKLRQRFALAHQLSHFALGHFSCNVEHDDSVQSFAQRDVPCAQDAAANRMALALLMPAAAVKLAIARGHTTVAGLSALFLVSEAAVRARLQAMGILRPRP